MQNRKRLKLGKNSYINNKLSSPANSGYYNDYDHEMIKAQERYKNSYITKVTKKKTNCKLTIYHTSLNPIEIDDIKFK